MGAGGSYHTYSGQCAGTARRSESRMPRKRVRNDSRTAGVRESCSEDASSSARATATDRRAVPAH